SARRASNGSMRTRLLLSVLVGALALCGQTVESLKLHQSRAEAAEYRGKKAVHLTQAPEVKGGAEDTLALVSGPEFGDGTIEVDVAGAPAAGAGEGARGFIGVAFRVQPGFAKYEVFYVRPTNGRADDQLRRNHSTQYVSFPDWPWQKLREQTPGVYESYVDLEPSVWTKMRITVEGTKARLYVNGAAQPCLIVNDLKLGASKGG